MGRVAQIRWKSKKQKNGMFDYILDFFFARKIEKTRKYDGEVNENPQVYKDQIEYIGDKVDDLLEIINEVINY